jgi:hypothetical protein
MVLPFTGSTYSINANVWRPQPIACRLMTLNDVMAVVLAEIQYGSPPTILAQPNTQMVSNIVQNTNFETFAATFGPQFSFDTET